MMQYKKVFFGKYKQGKFWKLYGKIFNYINIVISDKFPFRLFQTLISTLADFGFDNFYHTSLEDALNDPRLITPGMEDEEFMRQYIKWSFTLKNI